MRTTKQNRYFTNYFKEKNLPFSLIALGLVNEFHVHERKDGAEERSHLFEVMGSAIAYFENRLSIHELDKLVTIAALHDLVEDYQDKVSFKYLRTIFPKDILKSLKKVTKWKTFKKSDRDMTHYHTGISKNMYSTIVKALDRIHNLSSCHRVFSIEKKKFYINETEKYIIPNLKKMRREYPEFYTVLTSLVFQLKKEISVLNYIVELELRK